jgi:hypothetical protein
VAASKTSRTIQASASNAAGGTTNGTELDLSTKYGALVCGKITNGGTGPTVGCDMVVYVGESTGTKREFSRQTAPTTNSAVTEFVVEVPPGAMFVNVTFTGNTGQAVTVECYAQELTGI